MIVGSWPRRIVKWALRLGAGALVLALVAVPAAYFGLPPLARTDWARARMERALTRAVGAPVTVRQAEFSWKTGLCLREVVLAGSTFGRTEVSARVPEIRVHRHRRRLSPVLVAPEVRLRECEVASSAVRVRPCSLRLERIEVRDGRITYEPTAFAGGLRCEEFNGKLAVSRRKGVFHLAISSASATVNGGRVSGSASVTRGAKSVSLQANLNGSDLAANDLMARLARAAAPVLESRYREASYGRFSFSLKGSGSGRDLNDLLRNARAEGGIAVRGASLPGGTLSKGLTLREIDGRFALLEGKLVNPSLQARFTGDESWKLVGWTTTDGRLDYGVRASSGATYSITGTLDEPRVD